MKLFLLFILNLSSIYYLLLFQQQKVSFVAVRLKHVHFYTFLKINLLLVHLLKWAKLAQVIVILLILRFGSNFNFVMFDYFLNSQTVNHLRKFLNYFLLSNLHHLLCLLFSFILTFLFYHFYYNLKFILDFFELKFHHFYFLFNFDLENIKTSPAIAYSFKTLNHNQMYLIVYFFYLILLNYLFMKKISFFYPN